MAILLTAIVIMLALVYPIKFLSQTTDIRYFLGHYFGWYYLLIVTVMVFISIYLVVTPIGKITLGDPSSKPEHSKISWLAMLFSAGMGIGLVFYGAAEPLSHFAISSPEAQTYSREALSDALKYSFFHYGIHAWSIYALIALALAYFKFRKKERTLISATLKPLFGERMDGISGQMIDAVTIFATVVGVATTLGYGALQINGGLHYLFDIKEGVTVQLMIITVATVLFLISAVSGIGKGVKYLSNLNIVLAVILMIVAMIIGPKTQILNHFVESLGNYGQDFLRMSFRTAASSPEEQKWIQEWTILYWSWWISWSPFVGIFISSISKGRTIREFLVHVLLIPSAFSFMWFSVFGVMSINALNSDPSLVELTMENILFGTLSSYPLGWGMSILVIFLVFSFFITSADSATYVLAMQSENGSLTPHNSVKLIWGISVSLIASILLVAGGLDALQNVLIIVAFPFSMILILLVVSLLIELNYERQEMGLFIKPDTYPKKNEPFRSYEED
ncbi:BCCT family transporter [Atopobacter phocae]|uniref:BCCT family transporter n=1 Tax=Atopobacter phocae TaxID=136492 RepID=UPI0004AFA3A5|nr:BCCT family transporter [Atopobacter phocae]